MNANEMNLKKGKWLMANCGKYPSEKNCQMIFMAPNAQRDELLDTVVQHATQCHAHKNSNELRNELNNFLEEIEVR